MDAAALFAGAAAALTAALAKPAVLYIFYPFSYHKGCIEENCPSHNNCTENFHNITLSVKYLFYTCFIKYPPAGSLPGTPAPRSPRQEGAERRSS